MIRNPCDVFLFCYIRCYCVFTQNQLFIHFLYIEGFILFYFLEYFFILTTSPVYIPVYCVCYIYYKAIINNSNGVLLLPIFHSLFYLIIIISYIIIIYNSIKRQIEETFDCQKYHYLLLFIFIYSFLNTIVWQRQTTTKNNIV